MAIGPFGGAHVTHTYIRFYAMLLQKRGKIFRIAGWHGDIAGVMEQHNVFVKPRCPSSAEIVLFKYLQEPTAEIRVKVHQRGGNKLRHRHTSHQIIDLRTGKLFAKHPFVNMAEYGLKKHIIT